MTSDPSTPPEMENFWECNYKRLHQEFERYKVRHEALEKNYNELLKRVYAEKEPYVPVIRHLKKRE